MNKFPVIKITISFIAGILIQRIFSTGFEYSYLPLILFFGAALLLSILLKKHNNALLHLIILFSFLLSGAAVYSVYQAGLKEYPFNKRKITDCVAFGKIISIEMPKEGRIVFTSEVNKLEINSITVLMDHQFVVRIYEENKSRLSGLYDSLRIGEYFSLTGTIQKARDERNPGEFDYNNYLYHAGVSGLISLYQIDNFRVEKNSKISSYESFKNFFHSARIKIDRAIQKLHSPPEAALLRGLLLGDYKMIDEESIENYINAGVIHVLAVSGQHVALIILIFFFIFNRWNPYVKYVVSALGLIAFLFITGAQVSVERAVIMGLTFTGALLLCRSRNIYNILALSALIILIISPNELFSPGFQLSYSAVLSIVFIYPIIKEFIKSLHITNRILRNVLLYGGVSIAAQLGTLPFTLAYFNKLSIAAIFANLAVVPLSGIIIYGGIVTLFFYPLSVWAAGIFAAANGVLCRGTEFIVDIFGGNGYSFIAIKQFSIYDAITYYASLFTFLLVIKRFNYIIHKAGAVIVIFLTALIFMSFDNFAYWKPGELLITAVDVGQGDATLIRFPDGKSALIDAGNANIHFSNGDKIILPLMGRLGIDSLNCLFITHLDADHFYGVFKLLEKGNIEMVFKPVPEEKDSADFKFEKYLSERKIRVKHFSEEAIPFGGARLYFLNSNKLYSGVKTDKNNRSMLLKIVYGDNSFVFTGDAGREIEKRLAFLSPEFMKADILKAGHHGSRNSSDPDFLKVLSPARIFISCGIENKYNHPSPEVIKMYENMGIKIHRTDLSGALMFTSDGVKITNIDWKKRESRGIFDL